MKIGEGESKKARAFAFNCVQRVRLFVLPRFFLIQFCRFIVASKMENCIFIFYVLWVCVRVRVRVHGDRSIERTNERMH